VKGYICPKGHYCDARISVTEIKCPIGTYNSNTGGKYISDCLPCPAGFYQSTTGQAYCIECGTGATSSGGATGCSCKGKFRNWLSEKNTCEAKKGYTSDPEKYEIFSTSGAYEDLDAALGICKPSCGSNEFCNSNFECESKDCLKSCPNGDGSFSDKYKMCECTSQPKTASEACDSTCQAAASRFYYNSGISQYCCEFPCSPTQTVCKTATELNMYTGGTISSGDIPSMMASSTGMQGSQQCPPTMMAFKPACATDIYAARRNLNSDGKRFLAALATTYDQTLICLTSSVNTVTWDVTSTSFPTYNKDHPLNDDYSFDSSSFDTLKYKLVYGGVSLSTFTYSFSGISDYIALAFNDYSSSSKLTVVALNRGSCPNGNVMPLNADTLASVGISQASFLELEPMEWWLILFPIIFFLIAIGFGVLTKYLEEIYERRRIARLRKKKEFIREDGSVDRIQYLKDLYKVLKQYLENLNDDDPIKNIINNENDENERMRQSEVADSIKVVIEKFFDDLRFQDGELVEEKVLAESTDPSDDSKRSHEGSSDEQESQEFVVDDEMEDEGDAEGESQEADPLDLNELLGDEEDRIEEISEDDEDEKDMEAIMLIKKENERKRRDYEEG
jgi:hypothetical protein